MGLKKKEKIIICFCHRIAHLRPGVTTWKNLQTTCGSLQIEESSRKEQQKKRTLWEQVNEKYKVDELAKAVTAVAVPVFWESEKGFFVCFFFFLSMIYFRHHIIITGPEIVWRDGCIIYRLCADIFSRTNVRQHLWRKRVAGYWPARGNKAVQHGDCQPHDKQAERKALGTAEAWTHPWTLTYVRRKSYWYIHQIKHER